MKYPIFLLLCFFTCPLFSQKNDYESVIDYLNNTLSKYLYTNISESASNCSFLEVNNTPRDTSSCKVYIFKTNTEYNKHNREITIKYYYSEDIKILEEQEKTLNFEHKNTISMLNKEVIVRLNHYILCVTLNKDFEGSLRYIQLAVNQAVLDYENICNICE